MGFHDYMMGFDDYMMGFHDYRMGFDDDFFTHGIRWDLEWEAI